MNRAKLTAEAKALDRRRLDLIEARAEVEARLEKSEARYNDLARRNAGGRLTGRVPPNPAVAEAREAFQRDRETLERLDGELDDVERQLHRTRLALDSEHITAAAEAKLANLRETMTRQQAATETRRTTLQTLRKSYDAAAAELARLEARAAADLVAAAERGEAHTSGMDTAQTLARLRTTEAAIAQAEGLLTDCEAAEAATRRDIETAESEADHARALAAEFEALQVLRAALPAVAHWKASARRAFGYGGWRCPELSEMVHEYERQTETE